MFRLNFHQLFLECFSITKLMIMFKQQTTQLQVTWM